jgi:hypothetical protein
MASRCRDWLIREAKQIKLYPNNMNKQNRFSLSRSLKPLFYSLKQGSPTLFVGGPHWLSYKIMGTRLPNII